VITFIKFSYDVSADVKMSWEEVNRLFALAEQHYDGRCRMQAQLGGILHSMVKYFTPGEDLTVRLLTAQVDLLCKIAERDPELLFMLKAIFFGMDAEYRKVNPG
jgi:hypothetical protein